MNDEHILQARNIAEHAYCPRLFYYMQVEGVFLPSHDTERGQVVHRRVDRPSRSSGGAGSTGAYDEDESDPQRSRTVRSIHLVSVTLGVSGRLDLAEVTEADGTRSRPIAIPIEYRKGRSRRIDLEENELPDEEEPDQQPLCRVEPWPPDRIQIGLQVLLLEEHGYSVPRAVLYYAAEKRRIELVVDDALRREAMEELESARQTAAGPRPLPLVDSPKCPRCSLQPICLPDEVNHQRAAVSASPGPASPSTNPTPPRRIWPPRDDGIHVVAQRDGVRVGVRGQTLCFSDRDGVKVREMPIAGIESLAVISNVQISTQALHILASRGIPIAYMTPAGRTVAMLDPLGPVAAETRIAQVRRFDDPISCLDLARSVVSAKIINQRTLLLRNATAMPRSIADDLAQQAQHATHADSVDSLLGHEGTAARLYFQWFPSMLRSERLRDRFESTGRKRRPPPDPVNAVLSFGYAMLVHECTTALRLAGLEPAIGAFHRPRPGKPALALDLMEPFRPLIADSVAIALFNRDELRPGHFIDTAAGCAITDHGRRAFFRAWGRRMATVISHPVFDYRLEYRRMLMLHARLIAGWVRDEVPTLAFLTTR